MSTTCGPLNEFVVGNYYVRKKDDVVIKAKAPSEVTTYTYHTGASSRTEEFHKDNYNVRPKEARRATESERLWLDVCIAADTYIPRTDQRRIWTRDECDLHPKLHKEGRQYKRTGSWHSITESMLGSQLDVVSRNGHHIEKWMEYDSNLKLLTKSTWQDKYIADFLLGAVYECVTYDYIFRPSEIKSVGGFVEIKCSLLDTETELFNKECTFMLTEEEAKKVIRTGNRDKVWFLKCKTMGEYVPRHYGESTHGIHDGSVIDPFAESQAAQRARDWEFEMNMARLDSPHRNPMHFDMPIITGMPEKKETLDDILEPSIKKSRRRTKSNEFKLQSHTKLDIF
jgi:hypothetical protein